MGFFYWGETNKPRTCTNTRTRTRARSGVNDAGRSGRRRYERPVDLRDYFRGVGRYPGPRGLDLSERAWKAAPVERIPLDRVWATQSWISVAGLNHHARPGARPDGGHPACAIAYRGLFYICDGHHRVVTALDRGETHIHAHVIHPTTDTAGRRR